MSNEFFFAYEGRNDTQSPDDVIYNLFLELAFSALLVNSRRILMFEQPRL